MAYDLVAISGPVRGSRFPLSKARDTVIGRTHKGVNLPDPQVSVRHCQVVYDDGTYKVEDLGSATGTRVNGIEISERTPLSLGDVLFIGESELRVDSRMAQTIRVFSWAMLPAWLLVFAALCVLYWAGGDFPTVVTLKEPINTGVSGRTSRLIVPDTFIRTVGLDVQEHALRRVTDLDQNGLDELWLQKGDTETLVTFDGPDMIELGSFPIGCVDRESSVFPDLQCRGIEYRMLESGYVGVGQSAPVVWLKGTVLAAWTPVTKTPLEKPKAKKGQPPPEPEKRPDADAAVVNSTEEPVPLRVELSNVDELAGFLAARGVTQPVHYLICEDAFPGVVAQAVLRDGETHPLLYGCGDDVRFEGSRREAFEGAQIVAVAFSEIGRAALSKHLTYLWTGGTDPDFVPSEYRATIQSIDRWPVEIIGGLRLDFDAPAHVFSPLPKFLDLPDKVALLTDGVDLLQDAVSATILKPGISRFPVPGCADVEVEVHRFRCAWMRACWSSATFIEVRETGCGAEPRVLVQANYAGGLFEGESDHLDAKVVVEKTEGFAMTDVIRARVMVRPKP